MDTENLDIVYFVKDGFNNEELRYSLRSVDLNLPHKRVWIFGGCPTNIVPDVRVRIDQTGRTKWDKVRNMYSLVCENKEITDNFIMFNDDFFVMKPTTKIVPLYRGPLSEHVQILESNRPSEYSRLLKTVLNSFNGRPLSYELHVPFIFNKTKLTDIIKTFPDIRCTRTVYGYVYDIGGERASDVKVFSAKPKFDYKSTQFLSTDDSIVNVNNDVWRWLQKQFPNRSKWEI